MKKRDIFLLLWAICFWGSKQIQAQTLTFGQVMSLYSLSSAERARFLMEGAFTFEENESETISGELVNVQYYAWKSIPSNLGSTLAVVIMRTPDSQPDNPFEISYLTYIKKDYITAKLDAIKEGYEYEDTEDFENRTDNVYENGQFRVIFYSARYKGLNFHGVRVLKL